MSCHPSKTLSSSGADAATAGIGTAGADPAGTGAAMNGAEASVGADLPAGVAGTARRIAGLGFIVLDGRLREFIAPDDLLREPIVPVETDRAWAGRAADGREPAGPEVVAPVAVLVGVLVVAAAVDGRHDKAAIPATRYKARLRARFSCTASRGKQHP